MNDVLTLVHPAGRQGPAHTLDPDTLLVEAAGAPALLSTVRGAPLHRIVPADPLLGELLQLGVDVRSVGVLGTAAAEAAQVLARDLPGMAVWVDQARMSLARGQRRFTFPVGSLDPADRRLLLQALARLSTLGLVQRGPFADRHARFHPFWGFQLPDDAAVRRLIQGEWLSALAAAVLSDQARRLAVPLCLRTLVELEAAPDLGGWRAELDVLALAEVAGQQRLLWVESKTGAPDRIDCDSLAHRRDGLALVFARLGLPNPNPEVVVVVPAAQTPGREDALGALWLRLAELGIALVRPSELRRWANHVLGDARLRT